MKNIERNIFHDTRYRTPVYRVLVIRRGHPTATAHGVVFRGQYPTLKAARAARNAIESAIPPKPPGNPAGLVPRRTDADRRRERIAAGRCPTCGEEPPTPGYKSCPGCRLYNRIQYKAYCAAKKARLQ